MSFDPPLPPYGSTDPSARFLNASCLDLLLIELVPLAERMAFQSVPSNTTTSTKTKPTHPDGQAQPQDHDTTSSSTTTDAAGAPSLSTLSPTDQDTYLTLLHHRLDSLGYRVGLSLSERFSNTYIPLAPQSTPLSPTNASSSQPPGTSTLSPRPLFTTPLDAIKFLCKDLWLLLFKKQIDNLKTNHRGVYVLTDNMFRPLTKMSLTTKERTEAVERAQRYLWFPCGVIRGVLGSLGIDVSVVAETGELPVATFQIRTVGAPAGGFGLGGGGGR